MPRSLVAILNSQATDNTENEFVAATFSDVGEAAGLSQIDKTAMGQPTKIKLNLPDATQVGAAAACPKAEENPAIVSCQAFPREITGGEAGGSVTANGERNFDDLAVGAGNVVFDPGVLEDLTVKLGYISRVHNTPVGDPRRCLQAHPVDALGAGGSALMYQRDDELTIQDAVWTARIRTDGPNIGEMGSNEISFFARVPTTVNGVAVKTYSGQDDNAVTIGIPGFTLNGTGNTITLVSDAAGGVWKVGILPFTPLGTLGGISTTIPREDWIQVKILALDSGVIMVESFNEGGTLMLSQTIPGLMFDRIANRHIQMTLQATMKTAVGAGPQRPVMIDNYKHFILS